VELTGQYQEIEESDSDNWLGSEYYEERKVNHRKNREVERAKAG
jgi:hypothetical protein